jgi:DHA1 family inner membrane transport protein
VPFATSFAFAVGLLAFAIFVVVTTEFVVVALLPAMAGDLNVSLPEAGWFVTWFALASRCNPRDALVATALVFAAGNLAAALTPQYRLVVAVRMLQGCTLSVFAGIAIVAAARLAGVGREGWANSLVNIGVVAATVVGIPTGAMIADVAGWPASFALLALLGAISAALIAVRFPRLGSSTPPSLRTEASLLWRPAFLAHLLLSGILFTAMFAGYTYIAAFVGALLGAANGRDGAIIGGMLIGFGVAGVLGNWIAGRVVDRDPLLATGWVALVLALAMAAIGLTEGSPTLLIVLVGLWGAAHTAAFVFSQASAMMVGSDAPAFAMSLNISVCNLGIALGALIGGWVVDHYGAGASRYGAAVLAVGALLVAVAMTAARSRSPAAK